MTVSSSIGQYYDRGGNRNFFGEIVFPSEFNDIWIDSCVSPKKQKHSGASKCSMAEFFFVPLGLKRGSGDASNSE